MFGEYFSDAERLMPEPFPLDFDLDDGLCLSCGSVLDEEWICPDCGEDHFEGVMLLIGYGKARKAP